MTTSIRGRKALALAAALLLILLQPARLSTATPAPDSDGFTARVVRVVDGDTIDVHREGYRRPIRVRLDGIDTPERGRPYSAAATRFTRSHVFDRLVTILPKDSDRYGRLVARVLVDDLDLSVTLVTAGLAWHYTTFSSDPVLADAEREARASKRGMWANGDVAPPWRRGPPTSGKRPPR